MLDYYKNAAEKAHKKLDFAVCGFVAEMEGCLGKLISGKSTYKDVADAIDRIKVSVEALNDIREDCDQFDEYYAAELAKKRADEEATAAQIANEARRESVDSLLGDTEKEDAE